LRQLKYLLFLSNKWIYKKNKGFSYNIIWLAQLKMLVYRNKNEKWKFMYLIEKLRVGVPILQFLFSKCQTTH
jgi:hypothetical protein